MRIDKYLWAVRVFKTRSLATDACRGGKVCIEGQQLKPSRDVKLGEIITVKKDRVTYTYKVLELLEKRLGAKFIAQYIENLTPPEELEKLEIERMSAFILRDRGTGRPTKKDRRKLDTLYGN